MLWAGCSLFVTAQLVCSWTDKFGYNRKLNLVSLICYRSKQVFGWAMIGWI